MKSQKKFMKDFSQLVRKARQAKGISIEKLAFECETSYQTLSDLERGRKEFINSYLMYKLIQKLDLNPNEIF